MKKSLGIFVIAIMVILIIIVAVSMNNKVKMSLSDIQELTKTNGIEFEVIETNNKYIKFKLKNNTKVNLYYGADYDIQKYMNDGWYSYDVKIDFVRIEYILNPGLEHKENIYFGRTIGTLNKGKYRVIKKINNNLEYAEFTID